MTEQEKQQFRNRLRRLAGQARTLELTLAAGDQLKLIGQLEAVIAAAKAALAAYAAMEILSRDTLADDDKKTLRRLIQKSG